jgi:hypothetical protein
MAVAEMTGHKTFVSVWGQKTPSCGALFWRNLFFLELQGKAMDVD